MSADSPRRAFWLLPAGAVLLLLVVWFWPHEQPSAVKPKGTPAPAPTTARADVSTPARPNPVPMQPAHFPVEADGTVMIPAQFQLPGVTRAKSGNNSREWLAQYPADQQEKIQAFNKQHFGIYKVNSREQVAWMAQNGYPMPEDIIAAEHLSDADLRALWKQGNDKAGFLLQERNAVTIKAALEANRAQGKSAEDFWSANQTLWRDGENAMDLMHQSHSPYKGYAQAFMSALNEELDKDVEIIAGLRWAESLGDFRADRLGETYAGNDPIRRRMWEVAGRVGGNAASDSILMKTTGCQNAGVPPGMAIPGSYSPIE